MKSIKTMLLGIAFLVVAICGFLFLTAEWMIGLWMLYGGLIFGLVLCIAGFFSKE